MYREQLSISSLTAWVRLNSVQLNGVKIASFEDSRGLGVVTTEELSEDNAILMTVPRELLLSLENVWLYAKSDGRLREVLQAAGEYARTARGAVLLFLLFQISSPDFGSQNPWREYAKYLPSYVPLPTFWNEAERSLLSGTSLAAALEAKLRSLDREYSCLRDSTASISWCQQWWNELTFDDFKLVDALYRSRALDLPGTGHAMVPCVDMANHAAGDATNALYDTDQEGNAVLVLRDGKCLEPGVEVTITYGDAKGACEMLFSYGFLEDEMINARDLFLDITIPDDDPLKLAKSVGLKAAPGFRLYCDGDLITWEGPYVWLLCVNEEDGLKFRVLQTIDGDRELTVSWKDTLDDLGDAAELENVLKNDPQWSVFRLRAIVVIEARIQEQLITLHDSSVELDLLVSQVDAKSKVPGMALKLRDLEGEFLIKASETFDKQRQELLNSEAVVAYLARTSSQGTLEPEDDFT